MEWTFLGKEKRKGWRVYTIESDEPHLYEVALYIEKFKTYHPPVFYITGLTQESKKVKKELTDYFFSHPKERLRAPWREINFEEWKKAHGMDNPHRDLWGRNQKLKKKWTQTAI